MKNPIPYRPEIPFSEDLPNGDKVEVYRCQESTGVFISIGNDDGVVTCKVEETPALVQALSKAWAIAKDLTSLPEQDLPDTGWIVFYRLKSMPHAAPYRYKLVEEANNAYEALCVADHLEPRSDTWHSIYRSGKCLVTLQQARYERLDIEKIS